MLSPDEVRGNFLAEHTRPGEMQVTPSLKMDRFATNPSFSAPAPGVSAAMAPSFDPSRFGPSSYFDLSRLDDAAFDPNRLAEPAAVATTPAQLQRGLLDQQLNVGILPDIPPTAPTSWVNSPAIPPAAAPYIDSQVTARGPAAPRAPQAVDYATTASAPIGFDADTQKAAGQAAKFNSLLGTVQADRSKNTKLGSLLGLAAGGPIGLLAGALIGNMLSSNSKNAQRLGAFPSAPSFGGQIRQFFGSDPGNGGVNGLSDVGMADLGGRSGRDVYNDSGQFHDAVSSGRAGLW
jgi:hypothetical protein